MTFVLNFNEFVFMTIVHVFYFSSCNGPNDDPFKANFGCDDRKKKQNNYDRNFNTFTNDIDRQTMEMYSATKQSRRLICPDRDDAKNCRIRVDKAAELRGLSYMRAVTFLQSEEYLDVNDLDILKYLFFI